MIRISPVRVIDENGTQLGVMPTAQALSMAQERGFDLVEVAPNTAPPVTRFLDFGQYKYELAKREKEAKRRSRSVEFKEVRLKPKIGGGDFDTKVHRAIQFLEDGDRVKVTVQFRGRELTHPEIGRGLLTRFAEAIKDHGTVDRAPSLEGRAMSMTVTSTHKPKTHDAPRPGRPDGEQSSESSSGGQPTAATSTNGPAQTPPDATTNGAASEATNGTAPTPSPNGAAEAPSRAPVAAASASNRGPAGEPPAEPPAAAGD